MKKALFAKLLPAALALLLCACAAPAESQRQISQVSAPEDFAPLGVVIRPPEGADFVTCSIVDGTAAQVDFILNGAKYTYRAAKTDGDVSGLRVEPEGDPQDLNVCYETHCVQVHIQGLKSGGRLCTWNWPGGLRASLYTPDQVTDHDIGNLSLGLADDDWPPLS